MHERGDYTRPGGVNYETAAVGYRRRISWGAILAGTVAALSVQLLLTFLGLSIGLWAVDPTAGPAFFQGLGIGAAIWGLLSFIVALYVGGWIAGRMSGLGNRFDGMLEGFMVWGVVTVVTFMLLTTAVGGVIGVTGEAVAMAAEQVDDPEEMVEEYGEPAREARDELAAQAEEIGEDVAMAGAAASFWAFLALLLGAVAATLAGRQGSISGLKELTAERPVAGGPPPKA